MWKIAAHVSCDPLELLHVTHCAQFSSWWTNTTRYFCLKTVQNTSVCCHIMNKTQGVAKHVKNETFIRPLPKAFQTKNAFSERATPSLSRVRARCFSVHFRLTQNQIITNILLELIPEGNLHFGQVIRTAALQPARREKPVWNMFCWVKLLWWTCRTL